MEYSPIRYWRPLLLGMAALSTGCAPFQSITASGKSTGQCSSTLASQTGDSGATGQVQVNYTASVAQSFFLTQGQSFSSVSMKLEGFSSSNPSTLSGSLTIYVVPDASGGSTETQPNCSPQNGSSGCSGVASATGSLDLSTVSTSAVQFYNIPLTTPVTATASNNTPIWIVAAAGYASGSSNYVVWDSEVTSIANFLTLLTANNFGTANWTSASQTMTFEVCR